MQNQDTKAVDQFVENTMRAVQARTGFTGKDLHKATGLVLADWALENGRPESAKRFLDRVAAL